MSSLTTKAKLLRGSRQRDGGCVFVRAQAQTRQQMLIYVPPHPLIKHWLAIVRNAATPSTMFRGALAELGRVLLYEAGRESLSTIDASVQTPFAETDVTFIDPSKPIKLIPILRAGSVLMEHVSSVMPVHKIHHVGLHHDPLSHEVSFYYEQLPKTFSTEDSVVVSDAVLATGESVMKVLEEIVNRGAQPSNIRVICAVAAPPALKKMSERFVEIQVYAGIIDAEVNDQGFAVPGIGNAGDRAFGTGQQSF